MGTDSCYNFLLSLTIILIQDGFLIKIVKIVMHKCSLFTVPLLSDHSRGSFDDSTEKDGSVGAASSKASSSRPLRFVSGQAADRTEGGQADAGEAEEMKKKADAQSALLEFFHQTAEAKVRGKSVFERS